MTQVSVMSPRERWNAAIHLQPVDRLPFWPKLDGNYPAAQDAPFSGMTAKEIHKWVGSDQHEHVHSCLKEVRTNTALETTTEDGIMRTVYKTPHGDLLLVRRYDKPSSSWHPIEFPVKSLEDVKVLIEWYRDAKVEPDPEGIESANDRVKEIGDSAVIASGIGESPLMQWVEWLAGIENAQYFLADDRELVEKLFDVMHQNLVERTKVVVEHCPADIIYFVENTSTTLISPQQYKDYCFKHLMEYATIADTAGRAIVLHMCGHLKKILPDLAKLPVRAFEAFTSPTLGNTSFEDGRTACPDKCLIGGTNAMLWLRPASEIIAKIEQDLEPLPHHRGIVVTSAGVMPPYCKAETIKTVCDWVKSYNARM